MTDKASAFYTASFNRPIPVPYLLLERVTLLLSGRDEAEVLTVVKEAIVQCELHKRPKSEQIAYVVQRMVDLQGKMEEAEAEGSSNTIDLKTFAGEYLDWVKSMTPESMCMFLADYDYDKARYLYSTVDCGDVQVMADQKLQRDWQRVKTGFESVLFGFGGSYGDGEGDEHSLSEDDKRKELHKLMGL